MTSNRKICIVSDISVHQEITLGAIKAFPGYKLDDLSHVDPEKSQSGSK